MRFWFYDFAGIMKPQHQLAMLSIKLMQRHQKQRQREPVKVALPEKTKARK